MGEKKTTEALVEGGQATAGPPLGPALGPLGVNVLQIVNRINELTKTYKGMKVPVKVIVDVDTKEFDVEVGTPTTSALLIKELGIEKGSGTPNTQKVGNLSMEQLKRIAAMKLPGSFSKDLKGVALEIIGSCVSMGVTVEGRDPREVRDEIREGKWDGLLREA